MKKHLIFLDIDGTILHEKTRVISEKTKEAIVKARENGHETYINTGRNFAELNETILSAGFDGIVCGCGVFIQKDEEILFNHRVEQNLAKEIVSDLKKYKLDAILEGTDYIYIEENPTNTQIINFENYFGKEIKERIKYWNEGTLEFGKFTMWIKESSDYEGFAEKYKKYFQFIRREDGFAEVIPCGFSKATGIQYLMEKLQVAREHTIAIGDSENDLSMLEYAGIGIAMGNSVKEVFKKVDYTTKSIDEEGVYEALKHFKII